MSNAIITVSNKCGLDTLSNFLLEKGFTIYSTGGTYTNLEKGIKLFIKMEQKKMKQLNAMK